MVRGISQKRNHTMNSTNETTAASRAAAVAEKGAHVASKQATATEGSRNGNAACWPPWPTSASKPPSS